MRKSLLLLALALGCLALPGLGQEPEEVKLLDLINAFRAESPACWTGEGWSEWGTRWERELVRSPGVSNAAAAHNRFMIQSGCFDHICPGEQGLVERALAGGYPRQFRFVAENIARDFQTADGVFGLWESSPPHHHTMLFCFAKAVGIDRAFAEEARFGWYWTADFGDVADAQPTRWRRSTSTATTPSTTPKRSPPSSTGSRARVSRARSKWTTRPSKRSSNSGSPAMRSRRRGPRWLVSAHRL